MTQENNERVQLLNEAAERIHEAIELIDSATRGTSFHNECESYILAHLDNWAEGNNPHDSTAIPRLIERIRNNNEDGD